MKDCNGCKYAEWQRTKTGRLHPSGDGNCGYQYKVPPLPKSMFFITTPSPFGGYINRRKSFDDHCVYYLRVD